MGKKYTPKPAFNPVIQAIKIDRLRENVERMDAVINAVTSSHAQHMEHLSNFAKHDIGNAIQNMHAILKSNESALCIDLVSELKTSIQNVEEALISFEQLVPYTKEGDFKLNKLMSAIDLLSRSTISVNGISCDYVFDKQSDISIFQPFQALLQVVNNLIINSVRSLVNCDDKRILVEVLVNDDSVIFSIKDNGCGVPAENESKIFDYKFTTTPGGSGIGLYHAKYVCEKIGGTIRYFKSEGLYCTVFTINIPRYGDTEGINN